MNQPLADLAIEELVTAARSARFRRRLTSDALEFLGTRPLSSKIMQTAQPSAGSTFKFRGNYPMSTSAKSMHERT